MTTRVELRKVQVLGPNPSKFDTPIRLHLVLDVFEKPPKDAIDVTFTWSPVWDFPVDQELDEMEVGPFTTLGRHEFTIESDPPNVADIPDPTGPTALIVSLKYQGDEFLHIGYNITVTCEGDLPDVFTSADMLTRHIGKCYPKLRDISWDAPSPATASPSDSDADSTCDSADSPCKRAKRENEARS
ncbi:anti-silencing protein a-like protein [Leishmania donovani]|uniref:Anti-silencing_protein_a-like_protein n=3 Tax=Leishmania donovani species complex TaxID=38574 RepID=A0A6L0WY10_LEIIN|nr:anti-silencing protein a-like protein [Leishmania infantum JPCM5]TPP40898.1 ASF1 like histone chaperone family protein [Leishmania donovani]CAC9473893.1 anti-silencing_protein_a-like_protein [Leishmania infantum]CAJ1987587.1 anti-silencing protein a-like protein [Leishmania donovani]CAM66879.1 anti-silencing protein a-like protein [Leishmania infantum JPCM5]SUZ40577.1 anti-silencing_protein_a-like_protein [Leishmania infantum]|eukprot:XP_001464490.1 anti-silencing protein a-like protein [Leishmania infantum JPCM5]